jgi:prepilin-type N-terminal cleavage/methylation domain-containing protein
MPLADRAQRGFTLVEMLVVVGIILLVVGLLLPGLISSRKSAQVAVGAANLRSLSGMLISYGNEAKGQWYNPMATSGKGVKGYGRTPPFASEGFQAYWYSFMRDWSGKPGFAEEFLSPADGEHIGLVRNAGDTAHSELLIFPGSFYYSPTFFKKRDVFVTDECKIPYRCFADPIPPVTIGSWYINGVQDVSFPSSKVMLYVRADFTKPTRPGIPTPGKPGKSQAIPPSFNNPRANPHVAAVDGSVSTVLINDLTVAAAEGLEKDDWSYVPVDLLNVPDSMPRLTLTSEKSYAHGPIDLLSPFVDGQYAYFFGGTRDGLRGRDLP